MKTDIQQSARNYTRSGKSERSRLGKTICRRFKPEQSILRSEPDDTLDVLAVYRTPKKTYAGFTLIELLITMAIMAILAAIAIPAYRNYMQGSKNNVAISDIKTISTSLVIYQFENRRFPSSLTELEGVNLIDPWGHSYQYLNIDDDHPSKGKMRKDRFLVPINSDYDLYSMGADGKSVSPLTSKLSQDDIVRANNGGYLGLGSNY
ncbi:prepilin-type N-terminal cleavage/methylation domain-containing protein [Geopsychrobacter electrodiphilus]|uniref:prepilin-type N-terminal cleavage/methylation domain-containing protein n=1 Tax=Geopsychrobacter electrodiphilus TaxID=225196 RepID=UPI00035D65A7|nr:prepilin-type N-terminal cleavage/methylation domain-containing protein [Geopsychrobacter electrodiphilus]